MCTFFQDVSNQPTKYDEPKITVARAGSVSRVRSFAIMLVNSERGIIAITALGCLPRYHNQIHTKLRKNWNSK